MKVLLLILFSLSLKAQTVKQITASNGVVIRFLEYSKPDTKKHPLVIFFHGIGERSNTNIELVKINGLPDIVANSPDAIILAPQLTLNYGAWQRFYIDELIKYGKTLNVDTSQIILTGLSAGGAGIIDWAGQPGNSSKISALVPVCPACWYQYQDLKNITCPTWAIVGDSDKMVSPLCTYQMKGQIKNLTTIIYKGGDHGTAWYLGYKDTALYKWMFSQYRKIDTIIVKPDSVIVVPKPAWLKDTLKVISDGKEYTWTTDTGFIKSEHFSTGKHLFKNSTDSFTLEMEDTLRDPQVCNFLPKIKIGKDTTITGTTFTLTATAWDIDGIVVKYKWNKIYGSPSNGSIVSSTKLTTNVINLVKGVYTFQLIVTDNRLAVGIARIKVTVVK